MGILTDVMLEGSKLSLACGAVLACALLLTASCDGQSERGHGDGASTPVASSAFARDFSNAYCDSIGPCCGKGGYSFDLASCKRAVAGYIDAFVAQYEANPNVVFDEAVAGNCIAGYRADLVACTSKDLEHAASQACAGLIRGTVAQGGPCSESVDCAPVEGGYEQCDTGVCSVYEDEFDSSTGTHGKLGDTCDSSCHEDEYGTYCDGSITSDPSSGVSVGCFDSEGLHCARASLSCEALPTLGQSCPDYACSEGSYCAGGSCVASHATGPCNSGDECLSTSYCDYESSTCIPKKPNGQACDSSTECSAGDCEGDVCRDWSAASQEACAGLID